MKKHEYGKYFVVRPVLLKLKIESFRKGVYPDRFFRFHLLYLPLFHVQLHGYVCFRYSVSISGMY